jgi:4-amino-4-deoxy-L-arabinose transferase-like glycosyltransferase
LALLRLLSLGTAPLFDTTENRYANIAQQMILRQDWITPYIPAFHQPFLGKPPLSYWLTALSFMVFGCNEFSARFPNFIEGLLTLWFTFLVARKLFDRRTALLAPLILFSNLLFFVECGTVSMDMGVCLMTTASMWAYLCILKAARERRVWQRALYEILLGLWFGFGMLNKGPVSLVLFLGSIFLFGLFKRNLGLLFTPRWLIVLPVAAIVSLPWYLAMQQANPDFFNYFFVHEHFLRYLKSDYGDRYGAGHHQPYGMAWPFLLLSFLPWGVFLLPVGAWLKTLWHERGWRVPDSILLLSAWVIFTPIFFTFARSMLMPYLLTSFPPLAILCARLLSLEIHRLRNQTVPLRFSLLEPASCISWMAILTLLSGFGLALVYLKTFRLQMFGFIGYSLALLLSGIALWRTSARPVASRMGAGILLITLVFGLATSAWFAFLWQDRADTKSMKTVVALLKDKLPDYNQRETAFWAKTAPFSWYFYTQADTVNAVIAHQAKAPIIFPEPKEYETLPRGRRLLVVVTRGGLEGFRRKYPADAHTPLVSWGDYFIFDLPPL